MGDFIYRSGTGSGKMLRRCFLALLCFTGLTGTVYGQAEPTATRSGDLQVAGTFSLADSDYSVNRFRGYGGFASFDFRYHFGVVAEFHQLNDPVGSLATYERTYVAGVRYVLHYGRLRPYAKGVFGRGVFNYPKVGPGLGANIAYNVAAVGAGADYSLTRSISLRADYEYQEWLGFPPHGLTPQILEIGAAYRFH
jgi:opacity protein-like surface antigen